MVRPDISKLVRQAALRVSGDGPGGSAHRRRWLLRSARVGRRSKGRSGTAPQKHSVQLGGADQSGSPGRRPAQLHDERPGRRRRGGGRCQERLEDVGLPAHGVHLEVVDPLKLGLLDSGGQGRNANGQSPGVPILRQAVLAGLVAAEQPAPCPGGCAHIRLHHHQDAVLRPRSRPPSSGAAESESDPAQSRARTPSRRTGEAAQRRSARVGDPAPAKPRDRPALRPVPALGRKATAANSPGTAVLEAVGEWQRPLKIAHSWDSHVGSGATGVGSPECVAGQAPTPARGDRPDPGVRSRSVMPMAPRAGVPATCSTSMTVHAGTAFVVARPCPQLLVTIPSCRRRSGSRAGAGAGPAGRAVRARGGVAFCRQGLILIVVLQRGTLRESAT